MGTHLSCPHHPKDQRKKLKEKHTKCLWVVNVDRPALSWLEARSPKMRVWKVKMKTGVSMCMAIEPKVSNCQVNFRSLPLPQFKKWRLLFLSKGWENWDSLQTPETKSMQFWASSWLLQLLILQVWDQKLKYWFWYQTVFFKEGLWDSFLYLLHNIWFILQDQIC